MIRQLHRVGSFRAKVMWVALLTSSASIFAVALATGIRHYVQLAHQQIESVEAHSRMVALNTGTPLAFGDEEAAEQALEALAVVEDVLRASLFTTDGQRFASYRRSGADSGKSGEERMLPVGRWESAGASVLVVPVADLTGLQGTLQVSYSSARVRSEVLGSAGQILVIALAALALAWLLARMLGNVLTAPVIELDRTARAVTDSNDFSLRARRIGSDELARLTDRVNVLLAHIESSHAQLESAYRNAESASRLKDEFVATLSHELRTPMSPIIAWVQILRMRTRDDAEVGKGLEVIERNARNLVQIIDDLLDMSRIVSGTLRLDTRLVAIGDVVRSAIETVASTGDAKGVVMTTVLADDVLVRGDPSRLQQVVWNLLANAIKFTPSGGTVRVEVRRNGGRVEVRITDTGIGITPEFLPHVFERFRQQDGSITRVHGGLGLGLSIVRQLVELHGGSVTAASAGAGSGATFTVSLSYEAGEVVRRPQSSPAEDAVPRLDGLSVLVVEDQDDFRQLVSHALSAAGAQVRDARSLAEAIAAFDDVAPDLLISDIGMPDGDGYELIRRIRSRPDNLGGRVPAIAMTAYARSEDRTRALMAGFQLHLPKPAPASEVLAAVASLARDSRRARPPVSSGEREVRERPPTMSVAGSGSNLQA